MKERAANIAKEIVLSLIDHSKIPFSNGASGEARAEIVNKVFNSIYDNVKNKLEEE